MNTTLHLPINKEIKERAEAVVKEQGYSSLQEVLRVLVSSLAKGEVKAVFIHTEAPQILTAKQERHLHVREDQTRKAIKEGKAHKSQSVNEIMIVLEDTTRNHE